MQRWMRVSYTIRSDHGGFTDVDIYFFRRRPRDAITYDAAMVNQVCSRPHPTALDHPARRLCGYTFPFARIQIKPCVRPSQISPRHAFSVSFASSRPIHKPRYIQRSFIFKPLVSKTAVYGSLPTKGSPCMIFGRSTHHRRYVYVPPACSQYIVFTSRRVILVLQMLMTAGIHLAVIYAGQAKLLMDVVLDIYQISQQDAILRCPTYTIAPRRLPTESRIVSVHFSPKLGSTRVCQSVTSIRPAVQRWPPSHTFTLILCLES